MTNEKLLDYVKMKLEKLEKEKDHILDKMLELKSYENDDIYKIEYMKIVYAHEQMLDVKAFIETGVNLDYELKKREIKNLKNI